MYETRSTSKRKNEEHEQNLLNYNKVMKEFNDDTLEFSADDNYSNLQHLFTHSSLLSNDTLLNYSPLSVRINNKNESPPLNISPLSFLPFAQTEYLDDNAHNPNLAVAFDASKKLTEALSKEINSLVHSIRTYHDSTKSLEHIDFARKIDHDICNNDPIIYNVDSTDITKEPTSYCRLESSKAYNYKNEKTYNRYVFTFGLDIAESDGEDIYRCHEYSRNSLILVKHPNEQEKYSIQNSEIDASGFYDNYAFNTILGNHRLNL